ncbi:MAG: hypothetical protein KME04_17920 [Pleurocapsa minor GSE-CHR-MK-17-07R]|jgi:hypothetical protein|nr:hypothetical protein [Pleurocapsa minor GSE-CHR-MK 17-07R]
MPIDPLPPENSSDGPDWLDEFRDLANRQLEDGSSCEQVHPIVARWFEKLMQRDPPESRDSVLQAMSCLATEIIASAPEDMIDQVDEEEEDALAGFIEYVLMIGRAFEISLRSGELDDL